jgi:transcriptional regulator with XRE-family HTH domain
MSNDERRQQGRDQLAAGLRSRREGLGLSRREVADRSGLSYPYVSQLENGDREPSLDALARLAGALATSTEELLAVPVQRLGLSAPAPLRAPAPLLTEAAESAEAASWHANPSFGAAGAAGARAGSPAGGRRSVRRPPVAAAAVDEAYATLSALAPADRLDAAGMLLARCLRDAAAPE